MIEGIILVNMAFFAVMGATALAQPARITGCFSLPDLPAGMRNEVRAVYGGFGLAVAGLLGTAMIVEPVRAGVLLAIGVALLGMAAGRLASFALEGRAGPWPAVFLCVEVGLGGSLLAALAID